MEITLDMKWVAMAKAAEPLTLKNVLIEDPYVYIPLDQVAEVSS